MTKLERTYEVFGMPTGGHLTSFAVEWLTFEFMGWTTMGNNAERGYFLFTDTRYGPNYLKEYIDFMYLLN